MTQCRPPETSTRLGPTFESHTSSGLSWFGPAELVPEAEGKAWVVLKLSGSFDFEVYGILVAFIEPLSRAGIPVLTFSAYETDYVAVPEKKIDLALDCLKTAGHQKQ